MKPTEEIKKKQEDNPYYLPLPWEVTSFESGYQEHLPYVSAQEQEIVVGNASGSAHMPIWMLPGFHHDKVRNWFCITSRLRQKGFHLDPRTLELSVIDPLELPKGLEADERVTLLRSLNNYGVEIRRRLTAAVKDGSSIYSNSYQLELLEGLVDPDKDKRRLSNLAKKVLEWENPDIEYSDKNYTGEKTSTPRKKLIPRADQFDEKVRQLSFGDIFTLFQGSELESIKLAIGRACVGHPGTIDPDTKKKLVHTYRNICVISGNAGIGKSTLFGHLNAALRKVGYDVDTSCPPLNSRFNLRKALMSDVLFRDDTTTDNLIKELTSATAKILATNGHMATEEKGKDAENTKCKTMVFYLANEIDNKLFWHMDYGSRSRIKIVECVPEGAIPKSKLPFTHLDNLADELDVSIDTIMLWACRLAVDHFLQFTGDKAYELEAYVKSLEEKAHKSSADPLDGIMASIVLGYMVANPGKSIPKKLNCTVLAKSLEVIQRLKQDKSYEKVSHTLLETLEQTGATLSIPAWHPVQGLKRIDPASIGLAYDYATTASKGLTPNEQIKKVFSSLSLDDGNQCYGSPGTVIPRYFNLVNNEYTRGRLQKLADALVEVLPASRNMSPSSTDHDLDLFWNL